MLPPGKVDKKLQHYPKETRQLFQNFLEEYSAFIDRRDTDSTLDRLRSVLVLLFLSKQCLHNIRNPSVFLDPTIKEDLQNNRRILKKLQELFLEKLTAETVKDLYPQGVEYDRARSA